MFLQFGGDEATRTPDPSLERRCSPNPELHPVPASITGQWLLNAGAAFGGGPLGNWAGDA